MCECGDSELDFCSRKFDSEKALRSELAVPPMPEAHPLDNILKCRVYLPDSHPLHLSDTKKLRFSSKVLDNVSKQRVAATSLRQKTASKSNPSDTATRYFDERGPFSWLARKAKSGATVRVVTRHRRGVRGAATGVLVTFDKHMNLVLRHVEETYTVRRIVEVKSSNGVTRRRPVLEKRKRSLPNVLLMGRSIVFLSECDS